MLNSIILAVLLLTGFAHAQTVTDIPGQLGAAVLGKDLLVCKNSAKNRIVALDKVTLQPSKTFNLDPKLENILCHSAWVFDGYYYIFGSKYTSSQKYEGRVLTRFHDDGTLDQLFADKGFFWAGADTLSHTLAKDSSGNIYLALRGIGITRLLPDGKVDKSYGPLLPQSEDVWKLLVTSDDKLVIFSNPFYDDSIIWKFNKDGRYDALFGDMGELVFPFGFGSALEAVENQDRSLTILLRTPMRDEPAETRVMLLGENGTILRIHSWLFQWPVFGSPLLTSAAGYSILLYKGYDIDQWQLDANLQPITKTKSARRINYKDWRWLSTMPTTLLDGSSLIVFDTFLNLSSDESRIVISRH